MGRIRRTIIMGNPRGFVLKKFALIIATWAVVSVLVPTGASAVAEPDRVEEVNCDAVQVVIRVPPQNIDPLVPEEFKLRLNKEMAGLAIGANHCQQVKIVTDGRLVSDRETTFATLRVDIEEPSWDQEEGNELFHNYQFWIASDNKDLVRFFQKEGGATDRQAVHVEDMVFSLSPDDGTFFFDAPKPTPSPFQIKDARVGPLASPPLALEDAFWAAVGDGIMKESAHQDLLLLGEARGYLKPASRSELARILCSDERRWFEGDPVGVITDEPHRGSVRTFFPTGGYTLEVDKEQQASPTASASCSPDA